jgi:hypothetical protein
MRKSNKLTIMLALPFFLVGVWLWGAWFKSDVIDRWPSWDALGTAFFLILIPVTIILTAALNRTLDQAPLAFFVVFSFGGYVMSFVFPGLWIAQGLGWHPVIGLLGGIFICAISAKIFELAEKRWTRGRIPRS